MANVYQMVTDRIIAQLEQGIIPWQKTWTGVRGGAFNRISKKPYSLINQMMLRHDGEYASYKQWQSVGGQVRKGEKSEVVVFWKPYPVKEEKDGEEVTRMIPILRYYSVFHISQVDGVEPLEKPELNEGIEPLEEAENVLMGYIKREGIKFEQEASNEAYYAPLRDMIHLPLIEQFTDAAEYYSVAFHEATHSTMKETRCNRTQSIAAFGSETYSKEELVAEIGSAALLNITGIETAGTVKNNAAYIQNWLQVLKNDSRFVISASSKAEKAVRYILNDNTTEGAA